MVTFLAWLVLLVIAWPLAVLALILYPFVWLLSIPLRLIGVTVRGVFDLLDAMFALPSRLIRGPRSA